ncbi:MAG: HigA family addiction module antidote protein [Rubrivivax sp.]|nr:HigA family addiction module antidote protein [Rubrivivax sp.]
MNKRAPLARIGVPAGVPRRAPVHPGRFLQRHYLKPLGITQTDAARQLGISRQRLNELVQGHRAMTPDTAIRCALAFGLPVTQWLCMQAEWDCFHAWRALRQQLVSPPALTSFAVRAPQSAPARPSSSSARGLPAHAG